ncbi:MAG: helix-turn-helix transcriptional regulator [Gemmatimonadota bacterium]|mgnify:CR=1 FL=1|jgi:PadR family transcriptional regulator PadR
MPRGEYLGEFEQMILLAVARLGAHAYGITILEEIRERTGHEAAVASVYAALDRLERQGLVSSSVGNPTPERGGRAKRFFVLQPAGMDALERSRTALNSMWEGVRLDGDGVA